MLDVARQHVEPLRSEGADIELVECDVFAYEEAEAFDVVTCFGAFGHVPNREEELVDRVYRLLRPGGRFVFASAEMPPRTSPGYLVSKAFNAAMHVRNALVDPPFVMFYLTFMLPACARLLESRGFEVSRRPAGLERPLSRLEVVTATRTHDGRNRATAARSPG
jgi:ubiquinone/menaquinone biosynthesis C-methylase UbiE